ncbi:SDR family NAD(P)-dependent oxidoreductase [Allokutzneria sp. NRRL B-24872]|uniref:SDR family NAD(P)-dependent oxidoreductase n=1 Tax=Allokutzneria sp. NRRL B-24872 TaxID=1137961 RepID=UPI000A3CAE17|nr:SDR family oxidoreductase [Allokutzneria sp. NRRL B-24872]
MSERVAVVTGAAGGIGAATVEVLRERGWAVAGVDLAPSTADSSHIVDLRSTDALGGVLDEIQARLGRVTGLVNAAGLYRAVALPETTSDYAADVMAVNVTAPIMLCREVIARAGGPVSIVNVTSVVGRIGSHDPSYGASKGALIALTKGLASSYGKSGVRVNAVAPGVIETGMARSIPAERLGQYLETIPAGRLGEAEEVASVIAFLLSEEAAYVNGAVVDVNGGLA